MEPFHVRRLVYEVLGAVATRDRGPADHIADLRHLGGERSQRQSELQAWCFAHIADLHTPPNAATKVRVIVRVIMVWFPSTNSADAGGSR